MAPPLLLDAQDSLLVVIDVQEKFWPHVAPRDALGALTRLIGVARGLDLPIVVTEQYPKGIGPTIAPVQAALGAHYRPLAKTAFSLFAEPAILEAIRATRRNTVCLCGIESHICVLQSALDGVRHGYDLRVVRDAIACRGAENQQSALDTFARLAIATETWETIAYQWLRRSDSAAFGRLFALLKQARSAVPDQDARETVVGRDDGP